MDSELKSLRIDRSKKRRDEPSPWATRFIIAGVLLFVLLGAARFIYACDGPAIFALKRKVGAPGGLRCFGGRRHSLLFIAWAGLIKRGESDAGKFFERKATAEPIYASEKAELSTSRRLEKISPQSQLPLGQPETLERQVEPRCDLVRISPSAGLPLSKAGNVIFSAACRAHERHDAGRPIRELGLKPLLKESADFQRQAEQHIAGFARSRGSASLQDPFKLMVVHGRYQRRGQHSYGYPRG